MSKPVSMACALFLTLSVGGCATKPQVEFQADTKKSIKSIAIVEVPEPEKYMMHPGQAPAGPLLYVFGAIGGAVLGGIESSRIETASKSFTSAVAPFKPDVQSTFQNAVESGLKAKGYQVARVPAPPKTGQRDGYDLSKLQAGNYDAYLIGDFSGGYGVEGGRSAPRLLANVSLVGRSGAPTHFARSYIYGARKMFDGVQLAPETKYSFASAEATYSNGQLAAEALRTGASRIAAEVVAQF